MGGGGGGRGGSGTGGLYCAFKGGIGYIGRRIIIQFSFKLIQAGHKKPLKLENYGEAISGKLKWLFVASLGSRLAGVASEGGRLAGLD